MLINAFEIFSFNFIQEAYFTVISSISHNHYLQLNIYTQYAHTSSFTQYHAFNITHSTSQSQHHTLKLYTQRHALNIKHSKAPILAHLRSQRCRLIAHLTSYNQCRKRLYHRTYILKFSRLSVNLLTYVRTSEKVRTINPIAKFREPLACWSSGCMCAGSVVGVLVVDVLLLCPFQELRRPRSELGWWGLPWPTPWSVLHGSNLSIFINLSMSSFWSSVRPRDPVEVCVGLLVAAGSLCREAYAVRVHVDSLTLRCLPCSPPPTAMCDGVVDGWPGCGKFGLDALGWCWLLYFLGFAACAASTDGEPQSHQEVGGPGEPGGVLKLAVGKGHWRLQVYS